MPRTWSLPSGCLALACSLLFRPRCLYYLLPSFRRHFPLVRLSFSSVLHCSDICSFAGQSQRERVPSLRRAKLTFLLSSLILMRSGPGNLTPVRFILSSSLSSTHSNHPQAATPPHLLPSRSPLPHSHLTSNMATRPDDDSPMGSATPGDASPTPSSNSSNAGDDDLLAMDEDEVRLSSRFRVASGECGVRETLTRS